MLSILNSPVSSSPPELSVFEVLNSPASPSAVSKSQKSECTKPASASGFMLVDLGVQSRTDMHSSAGYSCALHA